MAPLAAVLAALGAGLALFAARRRERRLAQLGSMDIVHRLVPGRIVEHWRVRAMLYAASGLLLGVAVAGPQWGLAETRVSSEGVDIVLALDASLSMLAPDVRPNRLERMKQEVRRLRAASPGDRIGLIAFAGRSYILTPLTVDEGALELFLDNLDPSVVGQAGSSIARAIRQGTDLLVASPTASDRALVVMSDGEAFEPVEDIKDAAKRAADAGVSLIAVGFGTEAGATIPVEQGGRMVQKRDENGEIVTTHYEPAMLRAGADAAHGTFIDAHVTDQAAQVRRAVSALKTEHRTVRTGRDRAPRFQWFVLPALLLLLCDTVLAERRRSADRRASPDLSRPATVAALAILVCLQGAAPGPSRSRASQAAAKEYSAGHFLQAAAIYRSEMARGDATSQTLYNLGTALLAADSVDTAIEIFERLADDRDDDVRYRAGFNLGLAHLTRGLSGDGETEQRALDAALATYKHVLLLRPADLDAKWNYELALRKKKDAGGGGGGGGGENQSHAQPNMGSTSPEERPSGGLGQQQAEQILDNAAREERDVQERKQSQAKPTRPMFGKDW
jgi:Ca-activated chloride channel family protein